MIRGLVLILILLSIQSCVSALEDCIITTNAKLTNIQIKNHDIIDVFPLITVMNDRNTLIIHPLKIGETEFSVLKNGKNIELFNVKVNEDETIVNEVTGFDILQIDSPPGFYDIELDAPPIR